MSWRRDLSQDVGETTADIGELDVGEMTVGCPSQDLHQQQYAVTCPRIRQRGAWKTKGGNERTGINQIMEHLVEP